MINIEFTEEEMQALNYERFHHPYPHVQRKMEAIWLKSQKLSHKDICRLTGISPNTLRGYLRAYLKGGIEALKELNFYKPQSELCEHTKTIEAYFREHPPASVKEAMAKIEELTGIQRSENRVREFLKSIGMSPVLASTALMVLMTPGVGLFYAGMVRGKNVVSMIALAFVALVLVSVQWVLVGYSLAFSSDIAGFVGNLGFLGLNGVGMGCGDLTIPELAFMAFQLAFAVITLAIS